MSITLERLQSIKEFNICLLWQQVYLRACMSLFKDPKTSDCTTDKELQDEMNKLVENGVYFTVIGGAYSFGKNMGSGDAVKLLDL
jgi:hypothetical protein